MSPTRIVFMARSKICCSESVWLLMPYCKIGTVEALYWMMSGGVVPGGSCFRMVCDTAVIWATARFRRDARLKEYLDDANAVV